MRFLNGLILLPYVGPISWVEVEECLVMKLFSWQVPSLVSLLLLLVDRDFVPDKACDFDDDDVLKV